MCVSLAELRTIHPNYVSARLAAEKRPCVSVPCHTKHCINVSNEQFPKRGNIAVCIADQAKHDTTISSEHPLRSGAMFVCIVCIFTKRGSTRISYVSILHARRCSSVYELR